MRSRLRLLRNGACALVTLATLAASAEAQPKKAPTKAAAATRSEALVVVDATSHPKADYQAEVYSGVSLDDPYARERGLAQGLVLMVFEGQRRVAYRIPHERIRKVVRFATANEAPVMLVKSGKTPPALTRVDVLDTDDGVVAIETTTTNAGIFTSSDVYVFAKGDTLEKRLAKLAKTPPVVRDRLRAALTAAATR